MKPQKALIGLTTTAVAAGFLLIPEASAAPNKPALFISKVTTESGVEQQDGPQWGDLLYIGAVNTDRLERPVYEVRCTQNGEVVYGTSYKDLGPKYPGYEVTYNTLRSTLWSSGAADCTARLIDIYGGGKFPYRTISTLSFQVAA